MIELKVNGAVHRVDVASDTPLLLVLRNDLGLTAAKIGCSLQQCGCCTVLIDGEPQRSCTLALGSIAGAEVTTLEGIGTAEAPHPLQRAFIAENAAQCGYCTAGILVSAKALLDRNASPAREEIKTALKDHLCRCGAHNRVVKAVQRAAREGCER
jgi:nicotinate dehydrogenase subunit A